MSKPDRRLNAYRPDLADERLRGQVDAARFVAGHPASITAPVVDVHATPDQASGIDTQFLHGDSVLVFDRRQGWAWVQGTRDGYVGYIRESSLGASGFQHTHVLPVPRSFVYPEPELKTPPLAAFSMGARVIVVEEVEKRGTRYALLASGGAMVAGHLRPVGQPESDYVSVAEKFLHTPYLWGGASGFGIDCSGLVQLSMFMAGRRAPRDTDMQANHVGVPVNPAEGLMRGDLVFWRGHVAIMTDSQTIIHANGYTMSVSCERLADAIRRIEPFYGKPTGFRRPEQP